MGVSVKSGVPWQRLQEATQINIITTRNHLATISQGKEVKAAGS